MNNFVEVEKTVSQQTAPESVPVPVSPSNLSAHVARKVPFFEKVADRLGICLSALCVVHCLLTPVILLLLPSAQFFKFFTMHESYHQLMLIILPLLALLAFIPGFRLHGDRRVFLWAVPGIASIALGALVFEGSTFFEAGFSILGSCMLIRAHFINRVLCSCCETGHGRFAFNFGPWKNANGEGFGGFKRFRATKTLRNARLLSAPRRK